MKTKIFNQRIHAKKRLQQRFGININRHEYQELVKQIKCGRAKFLKRESNRVTLFLVEWQGRYIRVVYDGIRKNIVTALSCPCEEICPGNSIGRVAVLEIAL